MLSNEKKRDKSKTETDWLCHSISIWRGLTREHDNCCNFISLPIWRQRNFNFSFRTSFIRFDKLIYTIGYLRKFAAWFLRKQHQLNAAHSFHHAIYNVPFHYRERVLRDITFVIQFSWAVSLTFFFFLSVVVQQVHTLDMLCVWRIKWLSRLMNFHATQTDSMPMAQESTAVQNTKMMHSVLAQNRYN